MARNSTEQLSMADNSNPTSLSQTVDIRVQTELFKRSSQHLMELEAEILQIEHLQATFADGYGRTIDFNISLRFWYGCIAWNPILEFWRVSNIPSQLNCPTLLIILMV